MKRQSFWVPILVSLTGLLISGGPSLSLNENGVTELSYSAFYGGLEAAKIDARIAVSNGQYEVSTTVGSTGFLDYLFPFTSHTSGKGGFLRNPGVREFSLVSTFRGRTRKIKGTSGANVIPVWMITPPIPLDERDPVPQKLRIGVFDPVSALVNAAIRETAQEACSGTSRIFNGKVRTNIHLNYLGQEDLRSTRFSSFSGPAEKCEARYKTLAGGYKKSWFGSEAPPPEILYWISRIEGSEFWIPVRIEATTELAKVLVHLTAATTEQVNSIKKP
jgi:hypothetical protein